MPGNLLGVREKKDKKDSPCPAKSQSDGGKWQVDKWVQTITAKTGRQQVTGADEHSYQKLEIYSKCSCKRWHMIRTQKHSKNLENDMKKENGDE